jgi:prefoldin subunit 5
MKKQTLASRVLAFLKGGDEAKVARFESKLEKYFKKQIAMREESISNLEEKIADAKEELNETVVNVDVNRINSTDEAEGYVVVYLRSVQAKEAVVNGLQEQIDTLKEEIKALEKTQETVYSVEAEG